MSSRVTVDCPGCGKRRRTVNASGRCRACHEVELLVAPDPDDDVVDADVGPDEWRVGDELVPPRVWAARRWRQWSLAERAMFAGALESLLDELRGAGEGETARHRRLGRAA